MKSLKELSLKVVAESVMINQLIKTKINGECSPYQFLFLLLPKKIFKKYYILFWRNLRRTQALAIRNYVCNLPIPTSLPACPKIMFTMSYGKIGKFKLCSLCYFEKNIMKRKEKILSTDEAFELLQDDLATWCNHCKFRSLIVELEWNETKYNNK